MTDNEIVTIDRQTICKGCRTYELFGSCNFIPVIKRSKNKPEGLVCPCSTCLVKMMCLTDKNCKRIALYLKVMEPIRNKMDKTVQPRVLFIPEKAGNLSDD